MAHAGMSGINLFLGAVQLPSIATLRISGIVEFTVGFFPFNCSGMKSMY